MEGLIPYLVHALKKEKRPKHSYRSFSENSSVGRSYHRLMSESSSHNFAGAAVDGSSHRRTRSEFQQPLPDAIDNFLQRRSSSIKAASNVVVADSSGRRRMIIASK